MLCRGGATLADVRREDPGRSYPASHWDAQAADWDETVARATNPHQFYYYEADILISKALRDARRALELGCGTGGSMQIHQKEVSFLMATDFSREMVRRAAGKIRNGNVSFAAVQAGRLPFRPLSFDAIFSRGVLLSYVGDAPSMLSEVRRVLRPGGRVALDAMNRTAGWRGRVSRLFGTYEGVPVYMEYTIRGGKQIRTVYRLAGDSPWVERARREERCKRRPRNLDAHAVSVCQYEARLFGPRELRALVEQTGFEQVEITPLGHLANSLAFEDGELREFVRTNRDALCRLYLDLSKHFRLETAWHLFVTGVRR